MTSHGESDHVVRFYEDDEFLVRSVSIFAGAAIGSGEACIVIATPEHLEGIEARLVDNGIDVIRTKDRGQLLLLDANSVLSQLMKGEDPDPSAFDAVIGALVAQKLAQYPALRAYGEMVALLSQRGDNQAALKLEDLWNDLGARHTFSLLCGYPMNCLTGTADSETFRHICDRHTKVQPTESFPLGPEMGDAQMRSIAELQQKAGMLEREIARRTDVETELREQQRMLEIMNRVSASLVAEKELAAVVQVVTDAGTELSGAEFGAFFYNVVDSDGESYMLYTISGVDPEHFSKFPMPRNTGIFAPTFNGERVVRLADVTKDPNYGHNAPYHGMPPGHLPVRSYLAAPVISKEGVVLGGLFFGHSTPGIFGEKVEQVVVALAAQAAVAIDNAHLESAVHHDLIKLRKAEQSSRHFAAIVESSSDAIISKDLNGIIQSWNPGAQRIFGYTPEETIGNHVTMLFPENHINEEIAIISNIRAGIPVDHYETVRRRKDGSLIDISLTVSPIRNESGEIVGASKIVRDITKRKQDEEALLQATQALEQAKQELETRVAERTASLQEAIAQMEEFSYTVSHDLRAPLRAMKVYSNALLEDFGDLLASEPEAKRCVERVAENTIRLDKMIRDVLIFGRVAREKLAIHPVSLDALVADTIHHYPVLQPPSAIVEVEPLGWISGHEPSVVQILSNLLNNAVKFVAPGVTPRVRIWTEDGGAWLTLWVEDNGIGIDPAYHHRLFTMFERIHPDQKYEGSGVGLAIVRKATERMGGQAGVISDGANGSRFWVKLPKAEAQ